MYRKKIPENYLGSKYKCIVQFVKMRYVGKEYHK